MTAVLMAEGRLPGVGQPLAEWQAEMRALRDQLSEDLTLALQRIYQATGEATVGLARRSASRGEQAEKRGFRAMEELRRLRATLRDETNTARLAEQIEPLLRDLTAAGMLSMSGEIVERARPAASEGGARARLDLAQRLDPQRLEEEHILYYRAFAVSLVEETQQACVSQISDIVTRGLDQRWTDGEIARELVARNPLTDPAEARTIARTESTTFYAMGAAIAIEEAGEAVWGYEYDVIEDDGTTDICSALAGKVVAKDEMTAWPPFHYNCRTSVMPVLADRYGGPRNPTTTLSPQAERDIPEGFGHDLRQFIGAAA